jgi:hypothetical protein
VSECSASFLPDPSKGVPHQFRLALDHRYRTKLDNVARKLTVSLNEAQAFQQAVRQRLEPSDEHQALAMAYAQAIANAEVPLW